MNLMFFFFNDTAPTEIYTLSLHDALPISVDRKGTLWRGRTEDMNQWKSAHVVDTPHRTLSEAIKGADCFIGLSRSEEHTSELQSRQYLVCRLLLEKKKQKPKIQK